MATYDLNTNIGKVRLRIADTDTENTLFSDDEIAVFLDDNDDNVYLAVAEALRTIAADEALVAEVVKRGQYSTDRTKIPDILLALADRAEMKATQTGAGVSLAYKVGDRVFSTKQGSRPGSMDDW